MPKKVYGWEDGSPPPIGAHSLAKHRILGDYIQRYLEVLTVTPGIEAFRLALVDGFAGGGDYHDPVRRVVVPGSPQILLDAVRAAEFRINAARQKPIDFDVNFVFVEKVPAVAAYLRDVLTRRGDPPTTDGRIRLIQGAFEDNLDSIIAQIKSRGRVHRALFILDQYGYSGVPVPLLVRIFEQLPHAEVFLTLAVGWITAYVDNARAVAESFGLTSSMVDRLREQDDEALDLDDDSRRPTLEAIQRILHHAFTAEIGMRFYTPFFIMSRESNRPYWFLHLANSSRANDVVKTLHWERHNHFEHFGRPGYGMMLGYDPDAEGDPRQLPLFRFDEPARAQTASALLAATPSRIISRYGTGVTFEQLFQDACNETPATREQLAETVKTLCVEGELEKVGANGERRAPTTLPHDDDIIRMAKQLKLSLPKGSGSK